MNLSRNTLLLTAAIGVLCAVPCSAGADPVMPQAIYSAVQQGEDVEIRLWEDWEGSLEWTRTLVRRNLETDKLEVLFEDQTLTEDDPWDCAPEICVEPDHDACDEDPTSCTDCDGDDVAECPDWASTCYDWGCLISYTDECVRPGEMRYYLFEWEGEECVTDASFEITIEDVGQACPDGDLDDYECFYPPGPDADSDTDSDVDPDMDVDADVDADSDMGDPKAAGDGGCSVGSGVSLSEAPLTVLILALGLAAMFISRRRG